MKISRKGVVEVSVIVTLVTFLGTGLYSIYKVKRDTDRLKVMEQNVKSFQDKYCYVNDPLPEQQRMCIEALKLTLIRK